MDTPSPIPLIVTAQSQDKPGLVAAITSSIHHMGGTILECDQYTDLDANEFFLRLKATFHYPSAQAVLSAALAPIATRYAMQIHVWSPDTKVRAGILVSKQDHCLADLLQRYTKGELPLEIPMVLSNHADAAPLAERAGIPFQQCSVTTDTKRSQERRLLGFLKESRVECLILARYMQILSPEFLQQIACPVINIHHSFLPAFTGARPYDQAHARGVKLIGATAHYATEALDQGPIIAQATRPVTHRHRPNDLVRLGRELEQHVLAQAVRLHVERRILISHNKTVIFD